MLREGADLGISNPVMCPWIEDIVASKLRQCSCGFFALHLTFLEAKRKPLYLIFTSALLFIDF